ncbi:DIP1984 family protein, partial [Acinetobacter baumannii]|uniref:DIP1984 family protein n=1 Tax=Acinetobacter baumannii TaxID=470 RepID=UPI001C065AA2
MKLAEALLLRSDQQKKIISLKQLINSNVFVQDGYQTSEDPNELLKPVFSLILEFQKLSYAIHET